MQHTEARRHGDDTEKTLRVLRSFLRAVLRGLVRLVARVSVLHLTVTSVPSVPVSAILR